MRSVNGIIPFRGYRVWYRIVAGREAPRRLPVLVLHGGPGAAHDYLEPLEELAETGRRVIFYDQLGCGRSDRPQDQSLWTVDLFLRELATVRRVLGLDQVHILGHSWGGMLAMQYGLSRPAGLRSLILASATASMPQWVAEAGRLRAALPPDVQDMLVAHETAGTTSDAEYVEAMLAYYRRHVCRLDPWPDCVTRSVLALLQDTGVYETMNGPSDFHVTGRLREWDIIDRLPELQLPTMVTSGRHDEATPAIAETIHHGIAGSEWTIFEESSHMAHVEEPARYLSALNGFLTRVETAA
jgi:proline-specific peptidase